MTNLKFIDNKNNVIATLINNEGQPLKDDDILPLGHIFLDVAKDYYNNRSDNYNKFIDKIDVLFPEDNGANYKLANNTIKNNLGKRGYIISVKEFLKTFYSSDNGYYHFITELEQTIKYFNDIKININQDNTTKNENDILNASFGITSNVFISRQLDNDIYLYYEISTPYEAILNIISEEKEKDIKLVGIKDLETIKRDEEKELLKYFTKEEINKAMQELEYMKEHPEEYPSYDNIEDLKKALLSDDE